MALPCWCEFAQQRLFNSYFVYKCRTLSTEQLESWLNAPTKNEKNRQMDSVKPKRTLVQETYDILIDAICTDEIMPL